MSDPNLGIAPTKLGTPRLRPRTVPRARLLGALDGAVWQRLTLVIAPAGSGKSTLAAQWLRSRPEASAWLTLESEDDRPLALLRGLVAMLAPHLPEIAWTLPEEPAAALPYLQHRVVPALMGLTHPLLLVIDDAHHLARTDVVDVLAWFVEHLPEPVHLLVLARTMPSLPLARLKVRGEASVIDASQLRFSREESRAFYRDTMALQLDDGDVEALDARTEGWAAAMQLSALSVRAGVSPSTRAVAGDELLEQYLTEEVLAGQPEPVRRFLLRTSILERLHVDACVALTGEGAVALLEQVERAQLFLVSLDPTGTWWRYHALFAAMLRSALERSGEDVSGLHRRAATWALDAGLSREAFEHALAAQDETLLAKTLSRFGSALVAQRRHDVLVDWYRRLPPAFFERHPAAGIYALWTWVATRQPEAYEATRAQLERGCASASEEDRRLVSANLCASRAFTLHLSDRHDEVAALLDETVAHLADADHALHVLVAYIRGTMRMVRGEYYAALDALRVAGRGAVRIGNRGLAGGAAELRVRLLSLMGRFDEADALVGSLLSGEDAREHGFAVQQLAWGALCRGELDRAREAVTRSLHEHAYLYANDDLASGYALLALVHEVRGDTVAADLAALQASEALEGLGAQGGRLVHGILGVNRDDPRRVRAALDAVPLSAYATMEGRFWRSWLSAWWEARVTPESALARVRAEVAHAEQSGAVVFVALWSALEAAVAEAVGDAAGARDVAWTAAGWRWRASSGSRCQRPHRLLRCRSPSSGSPWSP
jgi:LuxR family maltose regulon positive regulatory protein